MALQKALVPVLLKGGLAQDTDEIALGLGEGFVLVENLRYDRGGVLKKRDGYEPVAADTFRGLSTVPTDKARSLHAHRGALVAALGSRVATYTLNGWADHGLNAPGTLRRTSAVRIPEASLENAQVVANDTFTVVTWLASDFLLYKQFDTVTGAVLQDERILVAGGVVRHRAFECGGDVVVVYYTTTTELRAFRLKFNYSSGTVVSPDLVLDTVAHDGPFDAAASVGEPGVFYVAWVVLRTGVRVGKYTVPGGPPLGALTLTAGPLTHADPDASGCGLGLYNNGDVWVAWSQLTGAVLSIRLGRWTPSPFAFAGATTVHTPGIPAASHANRLVVSYDGWVGWANAPAGGGFQLCDSAGLATGSRAIVYRAVPQSRFFRHDAADWIFLGEADTYFLVRPDQGQDLPRTVTYHGATCLDVAGGTLATHPFGEVELLGAARFRWAALVRTGVVSPSSTTTKGRKGVDLVDLDLDPNQAPVVVSCEANGCLVTGGALASWFDGQQVTEQGFLRPPLIELTTVVAGLGSIEGADIAPGIHNVYLYRACYEYQDERGLWHVSEPSPPVAVSVTLADTNAKIVLQLAHLLATRRGDVPWPGGRNARVAVFRSLKNNPDPSGLLGPYYRITDPNGANLPNARGQNFQTYEDTLSDAQVLALGFGQLYTDGGVLPNRLVPSLLAVTTWQGRVWGVSGEDPRQIVYTQELLPGEAPGWNPSELFVQVEEDATGVAPAGGSLLIFTRRRIYALSGLGPTLAGQGADWRGPTVVSEAVGCVDARSIVDFPGGVVFLAEQGFHLLPSPQATPVFLGGPVLQLTRDYPVCRGSAHDEANGRLLWTMARTTGQSLTLVFDYLRNAWMVWTPAGTSSTRYPGPLAVLDGQHWYGNAADVLRQDTVPTDDGNYVPWRLILPWARLGNVAGFERLWRVCVSLKRSVGTKLLTRLRTDDSTALDQEAEHDLGTLDAVTGERLVAETHVARQKCRSVQVELSEELVEPSDPTTESGTLELYGVDLEIGRKKGRWKTAPENRR
jgi:hypothetical protein